MNTSAVPPASIWRASTELAANEILTGTPDDFSQRGDNSSRTLVREAAANTRSAGRSRSAADSGAHTTQHNNTSRARRTVVMEFDKSQPAPGGRGAGSGIAGVGVLVALDERVGRVVVDGFEVLGLDHVRGDARLVVQPHGDVAHHVFDELRIVVGALGHVLLIWTLENSVQLTRSLALGHLDELLDPHVLAQLGLDGDVRSLVVRSTLGNLLRAGAKARDRDHDAHPHFGLAVLALADKAGAVVEVTLDPRHWRDRKSV